MKKVTTYNPTIFTDVKASVYMLIRTGYLCSINTHTCIRTYICNEADVNHVDGAAQDDMLIAQDEIFWTCYVSHEVQVGFKIFSIFLYAINNDIISCKLNTLCQIIRTPSL